MPTVYPHIRTRSRGMEEMYSMDTVSLPRQRVRLIVGCDLALYVQPHEGEAGEQVRWSEQCGNAVCLTTWWGRYSINRAVLRHAIRQAALAFDTHHSDPWDDIDPTEY